MTKIVSRTSDEMVQVPLSELISLRSTTFRLPEHATRPLDTSHVLELSESESSTWPSIEVVETDEGLAVIDGYHRWEGLARATWIKVLGIEDATPAKQRTALEVQHDEATQQKVQKALEETMIRAHIGVYKDEREVGKAALTANLHHGLAPHGKARVLIAMELYDLTRTETPPPNQAQIAREVGIARATLNEYLKKREEEQKRVKSVVSGDVDATEDVRGSSPEMEDEALYNQAEKKTDTFLKYANKLYEESPDTYTMVMCKLLPTVVQGVHDAFIDMSVPEYGEELRRSLLIPNEVKSEEVSYVARFTSALDSIIERANRNSARA
ncbi:MAG TPA: hypothetical protein VH593_20845, partial [Ktedonobacteraceae bacterium]